MEIVLRQDQAEIASQYLERAATYLLALTIKEALLNVYGKKPWENKDSNVVSAYIIGRLIRDAFAHGPIRPAWQITQKYENTTYEVIDIIRLNISGLDGKEFN